MNRVLVFIVLIFCSGLNAEEKSTSALEGDSAVFSLGGVVGVPAGIGLQLGVANIAHGGYINATAGYFGLGGTLALQGGYLFDNVGDFKQGLSLNGGATYWILPLVPFLIGEYWTGWFGPSYKMLFWDLLFVDLGLAATISVPGNHYFFFLPVDGGTSSWGVVPIVNAGLVWYF